MSHIMLRCTACGAGHHADMATLACRECSSPLQVEYQERAERHAPPGGSNAGDIPLPFHGSESGVSLGEGDTPSVKLSRSGELLDLNELYAKLEFLNPTGSFKDRGTAVMMFVAKENGVTEIVEDSSGNAGASVAAYAARAGIKAHIFAPATAPAAKLRQIKVYGAEVHAIPGSREDTTAAAVAYYRERGLVYASHALSPYFLEGTKSFAYEVAEQFGSALPDHIVLPVGNGSLLIGAWIGFQELRDAGRVAKAPRLHCVQTRAVMPIASAYQKTAWSVGDAGATVAGGIAVAAPARQREILEVLRDTHGVAVAVEEDDILRWKERLARREGIFAEPTSAAAFAGLEQLVSQGTVAAEDRVLVPVTGFGLKDDA